MTAADDIPNITLGPDAITVYTTSVEKIYSKKLVGVTPGQSSANWASGPKDTLIVDLLRVEIRFTVRGSIDSADQVAMENLFISGGVFDMVWDGTTYSIDMEKSTFTVAADKGEQDEKDILFTALVGVNI